MEGEDQNMGSIVVEVNPQIELMNSILYTSNHSKLIKNSMGFNSPITEIESDYTKAVKNFFNPYREHEIYKLIEKMTVNGFFLGRPIELMCSLGEPPMLQRKYEVYKLCRQLCGGEESINNLLSLLRKFSQETEYMKFFDSEKGYYQNLIEEASKYINKYALVSIMEEFYGKKQNSYHYIVTSLYRGCFGISFRSNSKLDMYIVMCDLLSTNVAIHEFAHPIINPLTEKYNHLVMKNSQAYEWLKQYQLPNYKSGYGDWNECVNEHIARAIAIYLGKKLGEEELASKHLEDDLKKGYMYLPALLDKFQYYERHRDIFKTIDDFYPVLIEVFADRI